MLLTNGSLLVLPTEVLRVGETVSKIRIYLNNRIIQKLIVVKGSRVAVLADVSMSPAGLNFNSVTRAGPHFNGKNRAGPLFNGKNRAGPPCNSKNRAGPYF
jgi:hypothetical protein